MPNRRTGVQTLREHKRLRARLDPLERSSSTIDDLRAAMLAEFEWCLDAALVDLRPGEALITSWTFDHVDEDDHVLTNRRQRSSGKLAAWRKAVLTRDGHRCRVCGSDEQLHAHHIERWADNADRRFDVTNGITLCQTHHSEVHRVTDR